MTGGGISLRIRPLVERLSKGTLLTNLEPLPDHVLDRLYQARDDDAGDPEGVEKLMAAQPIHNPE